MLIAAVSRAAFRRVVAAVTITGGVIGAVVGGSTFFPVIGSHPAWPPAVYVDGALMGATIGSALSHKARS